MKLRNTEHKIKKKISNIRWQVEPQTRSPWIRHVIIKIHIWRVIWDQIISDVIFIDKQIQNQNVDETRKKKIGWGRRVVRLFYMIRSVLPPLYSKSVYY